MDASGLDWGSVPDYLATFGVVGGLVVGIRTWAADRREQREKDTREREEQLTGVALVVADCIPPSTLPGNNVKRGLLCTVESLGKTPVFDVELTVRYVGPSDLVAPHLRTKDFEATVVSGTKELKVNIPVEQWPEIEFHNHDFDWDLTFTDVRGNRWRRARTGMPTPLGETSTPA